MVLGKELEQLADLVGLGVSVVRGLQDELEAVYLMPIEMMASLGTAMLEAERLQ